jgi:hypothetical protein
MTVEELWKVSLTLRKAARTRQKRLAELARQVAVCTKCDLALSRTNTVFGTGNVHSPLMLVGKGPGEAISLTAERLDALDNRVAKLERKPKAPAKAADK